MRNATYQTVQQGSCHCQWNLLTSLQRLATAYPCSLQGCKTASNCTGNDTKSIIECSHITRQWIYNCVLTWTARHGYIQCWWHEHFTNRTTSSPSVMRWSGIVDGACGRWSIKQPKHQCCGNSNECVEVIRILHDPLEYPTQATLFTAAKHGNLITFPGLIPENISRHSSKLDETQKGHMKQTK